MTQTQKRNFSNIYSTSKYFQFSNSFLLQFFRYFLCVNIVFFVCFLVKILVWNVFLFSDLFFLSEFISSCIVHTKPKKRLPSLWFSTWIKSISLPYCGFKICEFLQVFHSKIFALKLQCPSQSIIKQKQRAIQMTNDCCL